MNYIEIDTSAPKGGGKSGTKETHAAYQPTPILKAAIESAYGDEEDLQTVNRLWEEQFPLKRIYLDADGHPTDNLTNETTTFYGWELVKHIFLMHAQEEKDNFRQRVAAIFLAATATTWLLWEAPLHLELDAVEPLLKIAVIVGITVLIDHLQSRLSEHQTIANTSRKVGISPYAVRGIVNRTRDTQDPS